MKNLPTYTQFLCESITGERVVIFPGRYQPVHNGHVAAFERASKEYNLNVIPVQIISKNEKSPFPESLLEKIGNSVAKEFKFIEAFELYPQGKLTVIPQIVKWLRDKGYNPISMACGSDREKSYISQLNYINSERSDVPVTEPFIMKVVDERVQGGPSGTKVRESIATDNKAEFEKLTPKSVHQYYDELKKYL